MDEFCTCIKPKPRDITQHEQYMGDIREVKIGEYCENCDKYIAPKEVKGEN